MIKSYNDLIGQALAATAKPTRVTQLPDRSQIERAITAAGKSADARAKGAPRELDSGYVRDRIVVRRSFRNANPGIVVAGVPICLEHSPARRTPSRPDRK